MQEKRKRARRSAAMRKLAEGAAEKRAAARNARGRTAEARKVTRDAQDLTPAEVRARRNMRLVMVESTATAGLLAMSIMTPFFNEIGLNQAEIAATQAVFTVAVAVLNIPTGWLADRFSRKWANVIGDLGAAATFLAYSQVTGFAGVVICETLLGIFMALSQGVDTSLLQHFAEGVRPGKRFFRRQMARLSFWQYAAMLVLVMLGGPIGAIDFRLAIGLSGVAYLVGGVVAMLIQDDSEKLRPVHRNPLKDMGRVVRGSWARPALRLRILAYAVGRELTHGVVWIFTPMLLAAGVPLAVVSVGWGLNALANIVGARVAGRVGVGGRRRRFSVGKRRIGDLKASGGGRASKAGERGILGDGEGGLPDCVLGDGEGGLTDWVLLAVPLMLATVSMGVLAVDINIVTVWIYLLMGVAQGWTGATLMPLVQERAPRAEQTSVVSLAKVVGQVIYVPTVWLIGWAADFGLGWGCVMTLGIFVPVGWGICWGMRREGR